MREYRATFHDDGNTRMVLEFYCDRVYVHLRVRRWGPEVLRLMRARWPGIKQLLHEVGYVKINAFYRESNKLMPKFAGMFGFKEIKRAGGFVMMEVENA